MADQSTKIVSKDYLSDIMCTLGHRVHYNNFIKETLQYWVTLSTSKSIKIGHSSPPSRRLWSDMRIHYWRNILFKGVLNERELHPCRCSKFLHQHIVHNSRYLCLMKDWSGPREIFQLTEGYTMLLYISKLQQIGTSRKLEWICVDWTWNVVVTKVTKLKSVVVIPLRQ